MSSGLKYEDSSFALVERLIGRTIEDCISSVERPGYERLLTHEAGEVFFWKPTFDNFR